MRRTLHRYSVTSMHTDTQTHLHEVVSEVDGDKIGVEEEVFWHLLQAAASQVGLQRVPGHHLGSRSKG